MSAAEVFDIAPMNEQMHEALLYEEFLGEQPPLRETKHGVRSYDLLCSAMQDDSGNVCIVRKDPNAYSEDPTDWLVIRYEAGTQQLREEYVLSSKTETSEYGDSITLELVSDVSYHGPNLLRFTVDPLYRPDGEDIRLSHKKYYGRGVGPQAEEMVDAEYTNLMTGVDYHRSELADVIYLDDIRRRKEQANLGHVAVTGP